MNTKMFLPILMQGALAIGALLIPIPVIFIMGAMSIPFLLSLWISVLVVLKLMRSKNPKVVNTSLYVQVERYLYFQMVNWTFALYFISPIMSLVATFFPLVMVALLIKPENRANPKIIKWAKYIALHIFNASVLMFLIGGFPDASNPEVLMMIPIVTFINGAQSAIFAQIEARIESNLRRGFVLLIVVGMMIATIFSMISA